MIGAYSKAPLWFLFFLIAMGLGYATLNRYDPRDVPGLYDAKAYCAMVMNQSLQEDQRDLGHRILVPYLARPVYWLAKGRLHSWNPAFFALLTVNAFFTAWTALLIVLVGRSVAGQRIGLIGALLFLVNFATVNLNLAGYVDSAVTCMLMAMAWAMLSNRWWVLPFAATLGATAKETFVPMAIIMAFTWWLLDRGTLKLIWITAMALASVSAMVLVMVPETPAAFVSSRQAAGAGFFYLGGLWRCLTAREFLFTFLWLAPLALGSLRRLPRPWVMASFTAGASALVMGAYDDALGNAARAVFSAVGPVLSLAAALTLAD
ncbi:hypothetical protein [Occallatibacter savannae]|uniref:hypothetical protein n=1 Tax=Occallatibacter savannae TaxID=1002691 RepID=UPI000D68A499|nr:hypothetical protein [Occallatibacter savannae]